MSEAAQGYCIVWASRHLDGEVPRVTGDIATRGIADQQAVNIRLHPDTRRVVWVGTMADFFNRFEGHGLTGKEAGKLRVPDVSEWTTEDWRELWDLMNAFKARLAARHSSPAAPEAP